jgi:hypothetical protein
VYHRTPRMERRHDGRRLPYLLDAVPHLRQMTTSPVHIMEVLIEET